MTASPYSPEWRAARRLNRPEATDLPTEVLDDMGRGDRSLFDKFNAEQAVEADKAEAERQGITREGVVHNRLTARAQETVMPRVRAAINAEKKGEEGAAERLRAAEKAAVIALRESLRATFGKSVDMSTTNIATVPTQGTDIVPGEVGTSALRALQNYGALNRNSRILGLALGAVNHAGLRIMNPKVDDPEAGQLNSSNRVFKTTSRGPASIFFRDFTIMGGSQVDAINNMIDYGVRERMIDEGADPQSAAQYYNDVRDRVREVGIYEWWAETIGAKANEVGLEEALVDLGNFTEANYGSAKPEVSEAREAAMADFDQRFERGLARHGLNPRTAVNISGEERIVLMSIIDSLSDPTMMKWFKDSLGIEDDITPEEVAFAFSEPELQDKLMFLRPFEMVKDEEGNRVPHYNPFGDVVNSTQIVDPQIGPNSRPVFTEMNILNLLNATGNRRLMRRIVLANEFGVDLPMGLTGSQLTANPPVKGFDGDTPPLHGLMVTPPNERAADAQRGDIQMDLNKQGKAAVKKYGLKPNKKYPTTVAHIAAADYLYSFGLHNNIEARRMIEDMMGDQFDPVALRNALQSIEYATKGMRRKKMKSDDNVKVTKNTKAALKTTVVETRKKSEDGDLGGRDEVTIRDTSQDGELGGRDEVTIGDAPSGP